MKLVQISCPYCGLTKTLPRDKAPSRPVTANCPRCRHKFPIKPEKLKPVPQQPQQPPQQPRPTPRPQPSVQPSRSAEEPDPHAGIGGSPESIGRLFSQSFALFSSRFLTLFGVYILAIIMALVPGLLVGGGTALLFPVLPGLNWLIIPLGGLLAAAVSFYFLFWGYGAFIHAVIDQDCGFGLALQRARGQVWSFFWTLSLSAFLITGGYFLFFIPGVVLTVWFLFVPFIIAVESERGMDALLKSYHYVRGHWWNSFFKLFILALVCGGVGAIPLVGPFLSLLITPFMLVFFFSMYYDLRQIKGTHPVRAATGRKAKWIVAGSLGYVVLPVFILLTAGGTFFNALMTELPGRATGFGLEQFQGARQPRQQARTQADDGSQRDSTTQSPPQKVLESTATLSVTRTQVEPGATIFINFNGIEDPAPKDWIALYRIDDPNENYGQFDYLGSRPSGTMTFLAPSRPGVYQARLFLDWPDGGYHDVARTAEIRVGDMPNASPGPNREPASPLDKFRPKDR